MREYGELGFRKGPKGQHIGYMYYYNAEGKRRQVSKTAKAKKKSEAVKELRNWEAQLKREAAAHPLTHGNDLTVKEVVTAFLEEQLSRGFLEKSTHYTQITSAKRNIFPYIGDYLFSGVDNLIVEPDAKQHPHGVLNPQQNIQPLFLHRRYCPQPLLARANPEEGQRAHNVLGQRPA